MSEMVDEDGKKPYKIKDVNRQIKKAVVASNLDELQRKSSEKFGKSELPQIHLDSDGTEIDDEDYFQTLEPNTDLIAVFSGERWIDPTQSLTVATRNSDDMIDSGDVDNVHIQKLVGRVRTNICNISVLSDNELELLSDMDPESVTDIVGRDFIDTLRETSGRILTEKREAHDAIELIKLLGRHHTVSSQNSFDQHRPFSPSSSTTSLSTMSSFSSNNQQ